MGRVLQYDARTWELLRRRIILGVAVRYGGWVQGGCLAWCGTQNGHGYGQISVQGRMESTHRLAFALFGDEPLNPALELHHNCSYRLCCLPDHLEQVTHAENIARRAARRRYLIRHPEAASPSEAAWVERDNRRLLVVPRWDEHETQDAA